MVEGQDESSAMKSSHLHALSAPRFSSRIASNASTSLDRWALARIRDMVATARLRFRLWDGFELLSDSGAPVGTMVFKNRRALLSWIWNPDLNFGETYMFGAIDVRGDLVAVLSEIYRALSSDTPRHWRLLQRSNDQRAARENVHHHYDLGNTFYERLARSRDDVHVRLLSDSGDDARGGASGEDGSRLPKARAASW